MESKFLGGFLTVKAHACAVENNSLLVDNLVIRPEAFLALWHNGVVDKFCAADMIVDELGCRDILCQSLDIVLTLK